MAARALSWFRRGDHAEIQVPSHGAVDEFVPAARELLGAPALAGVRVQLVSDLDGSGDGAGTTAAAVADALGFTHRRTILRLRRTLPVPADDPVREHLPQLELRAFRPEDGDAWIAVNNRAFADHPDQGGETPASLADRLAEPWFTPDGFLVLDHPTHPGALAGFCWTKIHPATETEPAVGEIYVIGADPEFHGRGFGAALVLAGLDHLAGHGLSLAELFVEEDNLPARRLYERLEFEIHDRRLVFAR